MIEMVVVTVPTKLKLIGERKIKTCLGSRNNSGPLLMN
ncbi:hypothetical protein SHAM105786_15560 [Shewanella amazonensis]